MSDEKPDDWREVFKDRIFGRGRKIAELKHASKLYVKELGFIERPIEIAINGAGELTPKRRYLSMGRAIHMGIVRLRQNNDSMRRKLGLESILQPGMFRGLFMDLLEEREALLEALGLPADPIDPTPWFNPDQLEWAEDATMQRVQERYANGEYKRALDATQRGRDNADKTNKILREKRRVRKIAVDEVTGEPLPLPTRDLL